MPVTLRSAIADSRTFVKAVLTNQLARHAPAAYVRLTGETGRGSEPESAEEIAGYFERCFHDYVARLDAVGISLEAALQGADLLEYGPGDLPGVALLMYARGAARVTCADRFPLVRVSEKNQAVLRILMDRLPPAQRDRAATAFTVAGSPASGFREDAIRYVVTANGCVGQHAAYSLVYSRAVLEHVNDLAATFADMWQALRPGGLAIHEVDLKSHGLHRKDILDFLCWPDWAWSLMYSNKGYPNRWRIDRYRQLAAETGFDVLSLAPDERAPASAIAAVRGELPARFEALTDEDLSCLSFWMVLRRDAKPPP